MLFFRIQFLRLASRWLVALGCCLSLCASPVLGQKAPSIAKQGKAAQRLFDAGKYAEAQVVVDALLAQDSLNVGWRRARAMCQLNQPGYNHAEGALRDLTVALKQQPNDAQMLAQKGYAYYLLARYAESVTLMDQALALAPNQAVFIAQRGISKVFANRLLEGLTDLAQANSLIPDVETGVYLAYGQMLNNRNEAALQTCSALLTKYKTNSYVFATRALLRQRLNDPVNARKDADEALRLAPQEFNARLTSAYLYQATGDAATAQRLYDALQNEQTDKSKVIFERGDLHFQMNNLAAATTDWQQAAQLGNREAASRLSAGFKSQP